MLALGIPTASVASSPHRTTAQLGPTERPASAKKLRRGPAVPPPGASTSLISVTTGGGYSDGISDIVSFSSDGRFVAFESSGSNLVIGDVNSSTDAFVRDTVQNATTAVTRLSAGGGGQQPSISADGRYVAFTSGDSTLVPNDTNGLDDIFVRDRSNGTVTRVSVDSSGNQATGGRSDYPSISPNGQWVVFESLATNLVPNDTNGVLDIFVHDSQSGMTTRVSVASDGTQANNPASSGLPVIDINIPGEFITKIHFTG